MAGRRQEPLISFENALTIADQAVFSKTGRHLKNIEVAVLQGSLLGHNYDQIADEVGYAPEYIKHDVGPKLWKLLSASFGEKVSKTNVMAVLAQQTHRHNTTSVLPGDNGFKPSALEPPVGPVSLHSPLYLQRPPIESRCYDEILRPGSLIRIKAPRQMGKTSLMLRILDHAKQQLEHDGVMTVALSLQRADKAAFSDLDRFLRWFCTVITRKLKLPYRVEDYWSDTFGSKSNCTAYFEDCILSEIDGPLVLALDQVDEVFLHPEVADDFFTLLRSWYEEASYGDSGNPLWQNLRLIIVHSTEVYIPLDINKSPFNVGLAIELQPFTFDQVSILAKSYALNLSNADLQQLMDFIAGHPYLVQQALYHLATQNLTLEGLINTGATDASIYHHHLHRLLQNLREHHILSTTYQQVLEASAPIELEQLPAFKLHSMGLVVLQGNQVISSCQLYRQYFLTKNIVCDEG
ncbi:unknown [Crocosphaera subtropica ATCC 51142]|uniref:vWA-MoxR associated protein N-terminal HTH domain-containing protein n=1 Tax=Crocosphaera subtropica (strain ATCC 51142 / BH68) TaxID=43989 RepID=B1WPV8_CROS5|nr:AAA-like domain-containing protein [Crocosphaera subtropica]ACB53273.1 unknown [Crocosphaera subtropica ATCC 51142]